MKWIKTSFQMMRTIDRNFLRKWMLSPQSRLMPHLKKRESTLELRPYISRKVDKIEDFEFELTYYYQFCHGKNLI